jgi:hypothetical protein
MDSPLGTPSLDSASCHLSSPLNTPVTLIEIEDTSMTPIEIEDVETSATESMPVDGHGRGERPPLPRKKRNVSIEIKVPLMMIPWHIAIIVGLPINVIQKSMAPHQCCIM